MKSFLMWVSFVAIFSAFSGGITAVIIHKATIPQAKATFCTSCGCCFGDECECLNCPATKGTKR